MSVAADRVPRPELPEQWDRLERAAEEAALGSGFWKRRALEAEGEVARLRRTLEDLASDRDRPPDLEEEVRRLRAENAALHSRMSEARTRVSTLLRRLITLGVEL